MILARDGFEAFVSNTVARIFDRERQTRGIALRFVESVRRSLRCPAPDRSNLHGAHVSPGLSVGTALPVARGQGVKGQGNNEHRPYGAVLASRKPTRVLRSVGVA